MNNISGKTYIYIYMYICRRGKKERVERPGFPGRLVSFCLVVVVIDLWNQKSFEGIGCLQIDHLLYLKKHLFNQMQKSNWICCHLPSNYPSSLFLIHTHTHTHNSLAINIY